MNKCKRIVPAILTDDPAELERMLRQAETFTGYVQIDIMDGHFVPSRSVSWQDIAGISHRMDWDAHLMVLAPEEYVPGFRRAGAKRITFHHEATDDPRKIIAQIRKLDLEVGLAVNPETPLSAIAPLADTVDTVLFLAVHPGYYGGQFIAEVLDKVRGLREAHPDLEIGIDGGVKQDNILRVARSGADSIYVGSAIFLNQNPGERFRYLNSLVQQG